MVQSSESSEAVLKPRATVADGSSCRPFESMAKAYSLVIVNNNLNHRLKLMERLIREYQVDGLVIHSARSCKPYSVGQYDLKRLLTERLGGSLR